MEFFGQLHLFPTESPLHFMILSLLAYVLYPLLCEALETDTQGGFVVPGTLHLMYLEASPAAP